MGQIFGFSQQKSYLCTQNSHKNETKPPISADSRDVIPYAVPLLGGARAVVRPIFRGQYAAPRLCVCRQ